MLRRTVYLVDDDAEIVANVTTFLRDKHFEVRHFSKGSEFLQSLPLNMPAVIVLDMQMPGLNGLDIQSALIEQGVTSPIFFLSGDSKSQQIIDALKNGAYEFLLKPVMPTVLLDLLNKAFDQQEADEALNKERIQNQKRLALLNEYEQEIFNYFVQGFSNKHISEKLGLQADTIKKRRAQIYLKLEVNDLPDLIGKYGKLHDI
jgi:FixJ family two-component response regulator